jgi:hypothetical protein
LGPLCGGRILCRRSTVREFKLHHYRLGRLYPGRPSFAHKILTTAELVGALPRE